MKKDEGGRMNDDKKLIRNSTAEFLIFTGQAREQSIEAPYEDETVWLSQKLMAALFDVDVRTVYEHLKNVYEQGEVTPEATIRKFRIVQTEGKREVVRNVDFYNLDAIISVGYRVNSVRATQFRQWATRVLREFAIKGYVQDNGKITAQIAKDFAESEFEKYRIVQDRLFESDFDKVIRQLVLFQTIQQEKVVGFHVTIRNSKLHSYRRPSLLIMIPSFLMPRPGPLRMP
jgi:hypothetical protein